MLAPEPEGYKDALDAIRAAIESGRTRAARAITAEGLRLYWTIGRTLADHPQRFVWGSRVLDRLAQDLRLHFPNNTGFSARNLLYMRTLAHVFPREDFFDCALSRLPWGHLMLLIDSQHPSEVLRWYADAAEYHHWTQALLRAQIQAEAHRTQGAALTNFARTIPGPRADLVQQVLRDPYYFEFLSLNPAFTERELENALIEHIKRFMAEFDRGFAFMGSQVRLVVETDEFFIDLLFYHIYLKRMVVIDLKIDDFRPEYAGKMAFYLRAVDDQMKPPEDDPSIGLVLCTGKNKTVVEYTLGAIASPIAVAQYKVRQALPTEEQLQAVVEAGVEEFKQTHTIDLQQSALAVPPNLDLATRTSHLLSPHLRAALQIVTQKGSISNKEYVASASVTPVTAARHLQQLVAAGYLVSTGGGRAVRYLLATTNTAEAPGA